MQLPAGLLSDSWGPRKTITLFFGVAFAGSVILGMAPNVYVAIIGRTIVGVGIAMLFVPTLKVLAEWFRAKEFATMTGILMAMGGIGSYTAAAPLAYISNWIGWRQSFVLVGGLTLLLSALVWAFVRDRPADLGWPSPAEPAETGEESLGLMQGVKRVLSNHIGCRTGQPGVNGSGWFRPSRIQILLFGALSVRGGCADLKLFH
jgi:MFS family permease